jgi:hypothetical protein
MIESTDFIFPEGYGRPREPPHIYNFCKRNHLLSYSEKNKRKVPDADKMRKLLLDTLGSLIQLCTMGCNVLNGEISSTRVFFYIVTNYHQREI